MADPIIKRIDEHPNLVGVAAIDDKVLGIDASQSAPAQKTVLIAMNQLSIHSPSQLAANVVEGTKIKDGAVTNSKLGADAVDGTKIADNAVGNEHIRDSAALSVIGRSSSTSGNPADIVAGTDGHVLRLSGTTLGFGTVATAGIANGAVTPAKTSFAPSATTTNGVARFSNTSGSIKDTPTFTIADTGQMLITTTGHTAMYIDGADSTNTKYVMIARDGAGSNKFWVRNDGLVWAGGNMQIGGTLTVTGNATYAGDLSVSGKITGAKHVVYMQLFLPDEAIITASGRSQFFVPSYLAGGKVKQLGIGIVSASTPSVTVALGSSYGSVSGTSSTETADTLNYTLPAAKTKIPINVTCGAGTAPKGLDFWFVVLK